MGKEPFPRTQLLLPGIQQMLDLLWMWNPCGLPPTPTPPRPPSTSQGPSKAGSVVVINTTPTTCSPPTTQPGNKHPVSGHLCNYCKTKIFFFFGGGVHKYFFLTANSRTKHAEFEKYVAHSFMLHCLRMMCCPAVTPWHWKWQCETDGPVYHWMLQLDRWIQAWIRSHSCTFLQPNRSSSLEPYRYSYVLYVYLHPPLNQPHSLPSGCLYIPLL